MDAACFLTPSENSKNMVSSEGSYLGMLESSGIHKFGNGTSGRSTSHSTGCRPEINAALLVASTVRRVLR